MIWLSFKGGMLSNPKIPAHEGHDHVHHVTGNVTTDDDAYEKFKIIGGNFSGRKTGIKIRINRENQ